MLRCPCHRDGDQVHRRRWVGEDLSLKNCCYCLHSRSDCRLLKPQGSSRPQGLAIRHLSRPSTPVNAYFYTDYYAQCVLQQNEFMQ